MTQCLYYPQVQNMVMTTAIVIDTDSVNRDQYKEPIEGDYVSVDGMIYVIKKVTEYDDTWLVYGQPMSDTDGSFEHYGFKKSD